MLISRDIQQNFVMGHGEKESENINIIFVDTTKYHYVIGA